MKIGFFEDKNGNRSMMRLLSFMIVVDGLALISFAVIWSLVKGIDAIAIVTALIGLVTTGLGAKWAQKITENKEP